MSQLQVAQFDPPSITYADAEAMRQQRVAKYEKRNARLYGWRKRGVSTGRPPLRVRCVETGQEFDTCRDAVKLIGANIQHETISSAAIKGHLAAGFHWEWV